MPQKPNADVGDVGDVGDFGDVKNGIAKHKRPTMFGMMDWMR